MKKSVWAAAGLAVVLLAAAGGRLAIHVVESRTEQAVRDVLAEISASADSVTYSLLDNTLNLDGVAYTWGQGVLSASGTAKHIRVTGFNPACLDASFNGAELPLVADSLVASQVEVTSGFLNLKNQESIAEIRLEGWYQNLGKLAALYQQEPWSEAFFAEACRYRLDMLACRDSRAVVTGIGQGPVIASRAMYGLLGPAGSRKAAAQDGRTISLFVNDARMVHDRGSIQVERMETHDFRLPSPACASRMVWLFDKFQALAMDGDPDDPLETLLEISDAIGREVGAELGRDYWGSTPYGEIVLRGLTVESPNKGRLTRVDEARHRLSLADPLVFGLDLSGMHASWDAMSDAWQRVGPAFLPDGPVMDATLHLSLRPNRQLSRVEWSAAMRDLGRTGGSLSLELNTSDLRKLELSSQWPMARVFVKDVEADYADQGFAALALTMSALSGGTDVEREWNDIKAAVPVLIEDTGRLGPMLERAATVMLDRPGTLRIQCRPQEPLALGQLFMTLLLQPESLNLVISAEPGDKTLLDWIPAGLRQ